MLADKDELGSDAKRYGRWDCFRDNLRRPRGIREIAVQIKLLIQIFYLCPSVSICGESLCSARNAFFLTLFRFQSASRMRLAIASLKSLET